MPQTEAALVVSKGPLTSSVPLNMGLGLGAAGIVNAGTAQLSGDAVPNSVGLFLNFVMQPLKTLFPILKRHEWAIAVMIVLGFIVSVYLIRGGNIAQGFQDCMLGIADAMANYKSDKLSGLNMWKPAED